MEHDTHAAEAGHAAETAALAFYADPAFWAFVGLVLFFALLVWRKVPNALGKSLDDRSSKIAGELAAAEALRKEAEAKLEDAKRRQLEAETDAQAIVEAARKEAAQLAATATTQLNESIARRQKMAEDRIARAEAEAIRDVKITAVQTASTAAAAVLADQLSGKAADDYLAASLDSVKKALAQ
jgi:F-type H+-transporting ATPase subunit b